MVRNLQLYLSCATHIPFLHRGGAWLGHGNEQFIAEPQCDLTHVVFTGRHLVSGLASDSSAALKRTQSVSSLHWRLPGAPNSTPPGKRQGYPLHNANAGAVYQSKAFIISKIRSTLPF